MSKKQEKSQLPSRQGGVPVGEDELISTLDRLPYGRVMPAREHLVAQGPHVQNHIEGQRHEEGGLAVQVVLLHGIIDAVLLNEVPAKVGIFAQRAHALDEAVKRVAVMGIGLPELPLREAHAHHAAGAHGVAGEHAAVAMVADPPPSAPSGSPCRSPHPWLS